MNHSAAPREIDILQLDDSTTTLRCAKDRAESLGLKYEGVETLRALKDALDRVRARIYLVDGRFPVDKGQSIEFNAGKAIRCIQEKAGTDSRIILVSGEGDIENIAKKLIVDFIQKGGRSAQEVIEMVNTKLDPIAQIGDGGNHNQ